MSNEIVPVALEGELVHDELLSDYQKWEAEGMRNVYNNDYSKAHVYEAFAKPKGFFAKLFRL